MVQTTSARTGSGSRTAAIVTMVSLAMCGAALAQDSGSATRFGVAPSAGTQRALSDPPTQSTREQEGLYAGVGVGYTQRSNVRRTADDDDQDDGALVITPVAGYKRFIGRHSAEVNVSTQFIRFDDFESENTETYSVNGLANLDVTRILDVDLFATYTDLAEPRGGSGTRLDQDLEPDQVEITEYGGVVTLGRRAARLQFQVGADRSQWRYQNNQQQFRDRDDDRVHGRAYYNISPRTSVFAGASLTDIDFLRSATNPDSEELTYEAGARWEATAKTAGRFSIGRTEKDFDDPAAADARTTTLAGRVTWDARPRTSFSLYGSRQFEESTTADDDFFVSELIGASVNQSFGARINAFAYYNMTNDDYESGRNDDITDYGVGLDYSLRRWLSVGAQYSVIERDSNVPGEDYEDEVISLYLNGSFEIGSR